MAFAILNRATSKYLTPARKWSSDYDQAKFIEDIYEARKLRDVLNRGNRRRLVVAESRFDYRVLR
jgi:hypothetical protein